MHQIAIAFFEAGGDQLTVWFRPPGAVAAELPNNLLYTGTDSGEARVGTLDGADGAVRFTDLVRFAAARDGRRRHELQRRHSRSNR